MFASTHGVVDRARPTVKTQAARELAIDTLGSHAAASEPGGRGE